MHVWPSSQPTIETWALLHDLAPDKENGYCQLTRDSRVSCLQTSDQGDIRYLNDTDGPGLQGPEGRLGWLAPVSTCSLKS